MFQLPDDGVDFIAASVLAHQDHPVVGCTRRSFGLFPKTMCPSRVAGPLTKFQYSLQTGHAVESLSYILSTELRSAAAYNLNGSRTLDKSLWRFSSTPAPSRSMLNRRA